MDDWYYQIELQDGSFTPGVTRINLAMVREFLCRIDIRGASCLDIGTQEFVTPVLLLRQGAKSVVAYDRLSLPDRYELIKKTYDVEFNYVHGIEMRDLKAAAPGPYDIIVFSGVLYHMVDPLVGLAVARSMLRTGGIMVLETSVKRDSGTSIDFNARGTLFPGSNYFQPAIGTLDYWLRMFRLAPLDCAGLSAAADITRMVTICRAMDAPEAEPDDPWMHRGFVTNDFRPYGLNYTALRSSAPPVAYTASPDVVPRDGTNSIDLWQSLARKGRCVPNPDWHRLRLADTA